MSKPVGPYSPVVRAGEFVIVSGQIGIDAEGTIVAGGVTGQTEQVMKNLTARLDEMGAGLGDVVKTTCYLTDMENYATFNNAYLEAFGDHRPARACVAVLGLPLGALVEIEAVAHLPQ